MTKLTTPEKMALDLTIVGVLVNIKVFVDAFNVVSLFFIILGACTLCLMFTDVGGTK